ncbi:hypothetical protein JAO71_02500 [Olleya sp. YSTF-M6]|uniref:Cardiolipin synthetase n=1 Tax=Olleya sediminilitoris TaxID=2795739 RepID=A0ABS1WHQ4_9FLAO|nr:hypothetical protein [Olleya sediminilitoris]MBL7558660.1 hypothetical protein [Olleya sediminilitoris]
MRKLIIVLLSLTFLNCASTKLKEHWISPEANDYSLNKVLVIGLTKDTEVREKFEKKIQTQLTLRGLEANTSLTKFDTAFLEKERTETELKVIENQLLTQGYDAVIFTKVAAIKNKIQYKKNFQMLNHNKFKDDYLMYQDQYFNPDNYKEYQVYNAETSVYCLCPTKDRTLVWKGYIDIIDPENSSKIINQYAKLLLSVLEEDQIIPTLN